MKKYLLLCGAWMALTTGPAQAATSFLFSFDNTGLSAPRGLVGPTIVGSGVFTSADDLTVGTYALTSLSSFTMSFSFGGVSFTETDVSTPLSQVAVRISDFGSGVLRLQFTENGTPANGGSFNGSIDLVKGQDFLTFEPTSFGGNDYYQINSTTGRYLALSGAVPEPGTWAMMIAGFGLVGAGMRQRRALVRFSL